MGKEVVLKGTLSENVNKVYRVKTKIFHILHRKFSIADTPILINNFNRLEYLKVQIDWLRGNGHHNIFIIDNCSTYAPLLSFYKQTDVTVFRLDRNVGHEAFWRTHLYQRFGRYYHVLTDPDVLPDEQTPNDFLETFYALLMRYPAMQKVGFGLRIDDLPDYYPKKKEVISWEKQFETEEVEPGVYKAKIDTTFALYRPGAFLQCWENTLRMGSPYLLRHMPWYENPEALNEEAIFYNKRVGNSSSWYNAVKGKDNRYDI